MPSSPGYVTGGVVSQASSNDGIGVGRHVFEAVLELI